MMYPTNDSTSSQNYNQQQWPLNPAAYQNTPNDQIDWAALAQQWIIMKEAGPPVPEQLLTPPPPPKIQPVKKDNSFEGGEAPMEVEKDDDEQKPNWNDSNSTDSSWDWNQQQNWGWNNTWSSLPSVPPPVPGTSKAPLLPTPPTYNQYSNSNENSNNFGSYNNRTANEYSGGYWTASGSKIKPHNKRYSKVNVSTRPPASTPAIDPVMLDATKRKQLPAWIREGLEKMERDKQKQIERERVKQEKQDTNERSLFNEKEALEIIKSTVKERERSKFDSDGEDSPFEGDNGDMEPVSPENVLLTQEELMLRVRRTMTEILLRVTNQEIRAVCKEEFQRQLRKCKASDQRVSAPSGTNARGKLGLGMYGDSASSSEDSDDNYEHSRNNSDAELKDAIKRKKAEFSKTEREIEARLAAAEKHLDDSRGGTPKADSGDSQVDAKLQGYKAKLNKEVSPKTLYKHQKSHRDSSSSSDDSDTDSEGRKRAVARSRNSSSSESNQKYIKTKSKHLKNRNKSPSPDQKRKKTRSSEFKMKYSESSSSKSSSVRSRKSRSKSSENRRKKSRTPERPRHVYKKYYSKRSHSKSSSESNCSRSYTRSHRSASRSRRSQSYNKSRRSRSHTRSERSHRSRSRSERSRRSRSGSRCTVQSSKTHSRRKSKSYSPEVCHRRRLRSRSSSRGKRSNRH